MADEEEAVPEESEAQTGGGEEEELTAAGEGEGYEGGAEGESGGQFGSEETENDGQEGRDIEEAEEEEEEEEEEINICMKKAEERDTWKLLSYEEKKFYSKIYIDILMDIGTQNRILNEIRKRLCYLTEDNPCPTKCEEREIRGMKCCIRRETLRQQLYMKKAKEFLANAPCGPWDQIPIISSEVTDCMPTALNCTVIDEICQCALEENEKKRPEGKGC